MSWLEPTPEWDFFLEYPRPIVNPETLAAFEEQLSLRSPARVLETGSGASTIWFAQRAGLVLSFEDYPMWMARTMFALDHHKSNLFPHCIIEVRYEWDYSFRGFHRLQAVYDIVFIDGSDEPLARVETMKTAWKYVAPGGILVVDDAERPWYAEGLAALEAKDWTEKKVFSGKDFLGDYKQAVMFRRGYED